MYIAFSTLFIAIIAVILTYLLWAKVKFGKYMAIIFIFFVSYQIYITLNPKNSFYITEFKKITKQEFPKSGKIIKKYATLPDIHGDYVSCALIELSENDYKTLKTFLKKTNNKKENTNALCDAKWFNEKGAIANSLTHKKEGGSVSIWGLIKNKNQVFISYVSW